MNSATAPATPPITRFGNHWQLEALSISQGEAPRAISPPGWAVLLIPGLQPLSWRQGNVEQILRAPDDLLYLAPSDTAVQPSLCQGWRLGVDPERLNQLAVARAEHRLSSSRCRRRLLSSRRVQLRAATQQVQMAALRQILPLGHTLSPPAQQALTAAGLEGVILQLLAQLLCGDLIEKALRSNASARGRKAQIINDLLEWIANHLHRPIQLEDLVRESGYSQRSLRSIFHERFDCGPVQWIRQQRLQRARQLLLTATPDVTVSSVAAECGYDHLSQFSRDFRSVFQQRPSELLRQARRG